MDFQKPPEGIFVYTTRTSFDELDPLGILHHSRFAAYAERATFGLFQHLGIAPVFDEKKHPDLYHLVQNLQITFLHPLKGVIPFLIIMKVLRLREAGCILGFEFRSVDGSLVYARGQRTIIRMSFETGEPTGWSALFRESMSRWAELGAAIPWN